jgi:hypothetical protein
MPLNPEGPQQGDADLSIDSLRARIRTQSQAVADHIAADPEAKAFIDDWAAPVPVERGRASPSDS